MSWHCKKQAGYCSVLDTFQYHGRRLYYSNNLGQCRQYVENCNMVCKKCRFRRCEAVGMKRPQGDKKEGKEEKEGREGCAVCTSSLQTNRLGICQPCQMFLTDSVEENSQDSISCMRGGGCQVTATKTVAFSACTGCWMAKMKELGVLRAYLAKVAEDQREKCVVCCKRTDQAYQGQPCCPQCKKFFLRCAKSKCFKDFICSGGTGNSCAGVGSCSQCWWSKCVKMGLYSLYKGFGMPPTDSRTSSVEGSAEPSMKAPAYIR